MRNDEICLRRDKSRLVRTRDLFAHVIFALRELVASEERKK